MFVCMYVYLENLDLLMNLDIQTFWKGRIIWLTTNNKRYQMHGIYMMNGCLYIFVPTETMIDSPEGNWAAREPNKSVTKEVVKGTGNWTTNGVVFSYGGGTKIIDLLSVHKAH